MTDHYLAGLRMALKITHESWRDYPAGNFGSPNEERATRLFVDDLLGELQKAIALAKSDGDGEAARELIAAEID